MKRLSSLFSLVLTLLIVLSAVVPASAESGVSSGQITDDVSYTFDKESGVLTISGTGDYELSNNGYPWKSDISKVKKVIIGDGITRIGKHSFYNARYLTSVEIPSTVRSIGTYAFCYSGLKELVVPEGVEVIEERACDQCSNMKTLILPESLTEVGFMAFSISKSLTELKIPKSLTKIGQYAFTGCSKLERLTVDKDNPVYDSRENCNAIIETATNTMITACGVTSIPDSVTKIDGAFRHIEGLSEITLPAQITELGDDAFYDCVNLKSITLNNGLKKIGIEAFGYCEALESIEIPDTVTEIGKLLFYKCKSLKSVRLSAKTNYIPLGTFSCCLMLTEFTIPDNIVKLGDYAFENMEISEMFIPDTVVTIGKAIFLGCDNLEKVVVQDGNPVYDSRNGCNAVIETATNKLIAASRDTVIPEGVEIIGDYSFNSQSKTTFIDIPDSVTNIYPNAFSSCAELETVVIPKSVQKIGSNIFFMDDKLKHILYTGTEEEWKSLVSRVSSTNKFDKYEITYNYDRNHEHTEGEVEIVEADCEKDGLKTHYCAYCYQPYWVEAMPALGHIPGEPEEIFEPECEEDGMSAVFCTRCDAMLSSETIPALGHNAGEPVILKAASCEEDGLQEIYCERCNAFMAKEVIPATGHEENEPVISVHPSCEEDGLAVITCKNCGTLLSEKPVPATGHIKGEPEITHGVSCTDEGTVVTRCQVCGKTLETEITPAPGHVGDEPVITVLPGCVSDGYAIINCKNCGEMLATEPIPAQGHKFELHEPYCLNGCGEINPDYGPPTKATEPDTTEPTEPSTDRSENTDPTDEPQASAPTEPSAEITESTAPADSIGEGTPGTEVDKTVKALKTDDDIKGSSFIALSAKQSKVTKTSITVKWNKVKGAKTYVIYGNRCGKTGGKFNAYKKLKTLKKTSFTRKKLKKGAYYKYVVVAFDKNNKTLTVSKTLHISTKGGKTTNAKSLAAKPKSVTLKPGKTKTLKITTKAESKKLKLKQHRKIAFESSDTKVAKVSAKGKVTAKKKGACTIYAYAQNGVCKKIKVTVK